MSAQFACTFESSKLRHIALGAIIGIAIVQGVLALKTRRKSRLDTDIDGRSKRLSRGDGVVDGVVGLIGASPLSNTSINERRLKTKTKWVYYQGNTPLVRIKSLSDALGVEILGKAEVDQNK